MKALPKYDISLTKMMVDVLPYGNNFTAVIKTLIEDAIGMTEYAYHFANTRCQHLLQWFMSACHQLHVFQRIHSTIYPGSGSLSWNITGCCHVLWLIAWSDIFMEHYRMLSCLVANRLEWYLHGTLQDVVMSCGQSPGVISSLVHYRMLSCLVANRLEWYLPWYITGCCHVLWPIAWSDIFLGTLQDVVMSCGYRLEWYLPWYITGCCHVLWPIAWSDIFLGTLQDVVMSCGQSPGVISSLVHYRMLSCLVANRLEWYLPWYITECCHVLWPIAWSDIFLGTLQDVVMSCGQSPGVISSLVHYRMLSCLVANRLEWYLPWYITECCHVLWPIAWSDIFLGTLQNVVISCGQSPGVISSLVHFRMLSCLVANRLEWYLPWYITEYGHVLWPIAWSDIFLGTLQDIVMSCGYRLEWYLPWYITGCCHVLWPIAWSDIFLGTLQNVVMSCGQSPGVISSLVHYRMLSCLVANRLEWYLPWYITGYCHVLWLSPGVISSLVHYRMLSRLVAKCLEWYLPWYITGYCHVLWPIAWSDIFLGTLQDIVMSCGYRLEWYLPWYITGCCHVLWPIAWSDIFLGTLQDVVMSCGQSPGVISSLVHYRILSCLVAITWSDIFLGTLQDVVMSCGYRLEWYLPWYITGCCHVLWPIAWSDIFLGTLQDIVMSCGQSPGVISSLVHYRMLSCLVANRLEWYLPWYITGCCHVLWPIAWSDIFLGTLQDVVMSCGQSPGVISSLVHYRMLSCLVANRLEWYLPWYITGYCHVLWPIAWSNIFLGTLQDIVMSCGYRLEWYIPWYITGCCHVLWPIAWSDIFLGTLQDIVMSCGQSPGVISSLVHYRMLSCLVANRLEWYLPWYITGCCHVLWPIAWSDIFLGTLQDIVMSCGQSPGVISSLVHYRILSCLVAIAWSDIFLGTLQDVVTSCGQSPGVISSLVHYRILSCLVANRLEWYLPWYITGCCHVLWPIAWSDIFLGTLQDIVMSCGYRLEWYLPWYITGCCHVLWPIACSDIFLGTLQDVVMSCGQSPGVISSLVHYRMLSCLVANRLEWYLPWYITGCCHVLWPIAWSDIFLGTLQDVVMSCGQSPAVISSLVHYRMLSCLVANRLEWYLPWYITGYCHVLWPIAWSDIFLGTLQDVVTSCGQSPGVIYSLVHYRMFSRLVAWSGSPPVDNAPGCMAWK